MVYGGIGRAARDWESFDRIVAALRRLEDDQTLLVQSGKPVGVFRTHADAPRVLIANSNLVPHWATWEHFNELDRKGLMMYGQMTAGSWIYIGTQGIVQGTYETFVELGRQHYGGDLAGRWILTAGLGGMGGAQPLAATMAGASMPRHRMPADRRIEMRLRTGYLDRQARTSTRRWRSSSGMRRKETRSRSACSATPPTSSPNWCGAACGPTWSPTRPRRTIRSTAICRTAGPVAEWVARRESDPKAVETAARALDGRAGPRHARLPRAWACRPSTTATTSARWRKEEGVEDAFDFPGFVPAYIRPLFCRGIGPFRWAALSGDPEDIYSTDAKVKELLPDDKHLHNWLDMARERIKFQGLPARICWVGLGDRHRLGLAFNEMVASGELKAPIVIGRDHLDSGSVATPNRETEAMRDGSDAVSDWPLLNALLNCAVGRHLGVAAPRRRRRHGLFAARRHGHRLRRHAGGRAAHRARAVERPGHRRHAPRRRRLRDRHRLRARAGPRSAGGSAWRRWPRAARFRPFPASIAGSRCWWGTLSCASKAADR